MKIIEMDLRCKRTWFSMSSPELIFTIHSGFLTLESGAWQKGQFRTQDTGQLLSRRFSLPSPYETGRDGWLCWPTPSSHGHPRTSSVCPVLSPKPVPSIYHVWPSNIPAAKTQRSRAARCKVPPYFLPSPFSLSIWITEGTVIFQAIISCFPFPQHPIVTECLSFPVVGPMQMELNSRHITHAQT